MLDLLNHVNLFVFGICLWVVLSIFFSFLIMRGDAKQQARNEALTTGPPCPTCTAPSLRYDRWMCTYTIDSNVGGEERPTEGWMFTCNHCGGQFEAPPPPPLACPTCAAAPWLRYDRAFWSFDSVADRFDGWTFACRNCGGTTFFDREGRPAAEPDPSARARIPRVHPIHTPPRLP